MVLKLLICMVAVSALEGVFGLPDKQGVNGTQSKANLGHGKAQRGRRLDKLPCQMSHGICQRLDDDCYGVLEEGPIWCLHSRHFGCCIPQSGTFGCELKDTVYRDGAIAEDGCIRLMCSTGKWSYLGLNENCGVSSIIGTTIIPFVPHPPLGNEYTITGDRGVYSLSQRGFTSDPPFGVDIYIVDGYIECIVVYCGGLEVEICCGREGSYPWVWVNGHRILTLIGVRMPLPPCADCPVYMIFKSSSIYIIFPHCTICVTWVPGADPWLFSVSVIVHESMYWELYGLSGVWVPPPYPDNGTMQGGGKTDNLHDFIKSWKLPHTRSHVKHGRKNPSSVHTGQVTVRPKIERSMSDIAKICEEMNKDLCTILPSEKCEKIMDYCMSSMSGLSDSSE